MTVSAPWLSILIPAHNVERYLAACLASIHRNRASGVEVVVLDDASTDNTRGLALQWMRSFPQCRLLDAPRNVGVAEARNILLAQARGDYIWFIDSDDVLLPGSLLRLKAIVDARVPDLVMCDFVSFRSEDDGPRGFLRASRKRTFRGSRGPGAGMDPLVSGLFANRQLHLWSKIARKEMFENARFPPGKVFEDNAVIPAILAGVGSYYYSAEVWVGYRRRPGSIMSTIGGKSVKDFLDSIEGLRRGVFPLIRSPEARFSLDYFCLRGLQWALNRIERGDEVSRLHCAKVFHRMFPDGLESVFRECVRRGWLLRAFRLRGAVKEMRCLGKCLD